MTVRRTVSGLSVTGSCRLVVTSVLTSSDVSLTSGTRSPDETDGSVGSVTRSVFEIPFEIKIPTNSSLEDFLVSDGMEAGTLAILYDLYLGQGLQ